MLLKCLVLGSVLCFISLNHKVKSGIPPDVDALIPAELKEMMTSLRRVCTKKVGITPDEIEKYKMNPNTPESIKCYMECLMLSARWMSPKGIINYQLIIDTTPPGIKDGLTKMINQCREIPVVGSKCDIAFNFNACMAKADPVHYFLP